MRKIVSFEQFNPADFQNDHIGMWAAHLGMSREEYVAHYASPTIGSGIDEELNPMEFKHAMEANDHEVGMAQGQLEAIHKAAGELQEKIGNEEKDLPGWIQDHISQAYSFLQQANDNFHELEEAEVNEKLKMLMNPLMVKIMKQFGFGSDPGIRAELREEIQAAVEEVLKRHDIIVE